MKTRERYELIRELLWWYPLSSPLLLLRTPLIYGLVWTGMPLWLAIVFEFLIERPAFYMLARYIHNRKGSLT